MQMLNIDNGVTYNTEFLGRKNRKSIRRKNKFVNFANSMKKFFLGVGSLYIIVSLIAYILFCQVRLNNAIANIQKDTNIPRYVIDKVVDYLN